MVQSKGWEWEKVANSSPWLNPSEDGVYCAYKWSAAGRRKVLDLGAGLGRHSICFAKHGLQVSALDLSPYAIDPLNAWASKENVTVETTVGDIARLPYEDESFDAVLFIMRSRIRIRRA
ncbi:class I SAM-dependent methyltransferase [Gorillibacterium sp. sgz5001074]|uniref:class I SAM-dependent methyltransferase n=1 Tax=Gorillibacterium sp. sgz5001074 TaxID=3446695 RepID=UPI003F661F9C